MLYAIKQDLWKATEVDKARDVRASPSLAEVLKSIKEPIVKVTDTTL